MFADCGQRDEQKIEIEGLDSVCSHGGLVPCLFSLSSKNPLPWANVRYI